MVFSTREAENGCLVLPDGQVILGKEKHLDPSGAKCLRSLKRHMPLLRGLVCLCLSYYRPRVTALKIDMQQRESFFCFGPTTCFTT
jgi:hypothetical protein